MWTFLLLLLNKLQTSVCTCSVPGTSSQKQEEEVTLGPGPASLHLWSDDYTLGSNLNGKFSTHVHHKPYLSHIHDGLTFSASALHTDGLGPADNSINYPLSTSIVPSPHMHGWYGSELSHPDVDVTQALFVASDFMNKSYIWILLGFLLLTKQ